MQIVKNITIIRSISAPKYENTNRVRGVNIEESPKKTVHNLRKGDR